MNEARRSPTHDRAIGREIAAELQKLPVPIAEWQRLTAKFYVAALRGKSHPQAQELLEQVRIARRRVETIRAGLSPRAAKDSRFTDKIRSLDQLEQHLERTLRFSGERPV